MPQSQAMVEIDAVSKAFGAQAAVVDASLALARGAFLTILGPSGCGKTTLLRMIAGFLAPDRGEIRIKGRPTADTPPHKRSIGMVFQRLALFPHLSAADNIAYPLHRRGFPRAEIPERTRAALALVKLDGLGARRPHELSGGQQQRVAIARALSFGPDLLLLDEPLSALDKKLREEMQLEFRRIQQELGVTTINVTHDQREALVMSDKIVVMSAGRIQQDADPVTLYRAPANRFVAEFVGLTASFRAEATETPANGRIRLRRGGASLSAQPIGEGLRPGVRVDCAIRAEQVRLLEAAPTPGEPALDTVLEGVVEGRIFEGDRMVYQLAAPALADGVEPVRLFAFDHDPARHSPRVIGATVRLGWNAADLHAFAAAPGAKAARPDHPPAQ